MPPCDIKRTVCTGGARRGAGRGSTAPERVLPAFHSARSLTFRECSLPMAILFHPCYVWLPFGGPSAVAGCPQRAPEAARRAAAPVGRDVRRARPASRRRDHRRGSPCASSLPSGDGGRTANGRKGRLEATLIVRGCLLPVPGAGSSLRPDPCRWSPRRQLDPWPPPAVDYRPPRF